MDAKFLHADNEDADQTARMHRLVCLRWAHISEGTFSPVASQIIADSVKQNHEID